MREEWAKGWLIGTASGIGNAAGAYILKLQGYSQPAVDVTLFLAFMSLSYAILCAIAYLRAKS